MTVPPRVCVTGPESTGKTTLASRLAEWAHASWVPEASRRYAERKGTELDASDVEPIAREHMALEDAALSAARAAGEPVLLLDADLISTAAYARHYYGAVPALVEREARARAADLYLLCDVDVPWVPDGVRDRPERREEMFALFGETLASYGVAPVVVRGDWEARWTIARDAVTRLLQEQGTAR